MDAPRPRATGLAGAPGGRCSSRLRRRATDLRRCDAGVRGRATELRVVPGLRARLRVRLAGKVAFDFQPLSPGLAVGVAYALSAAATVLLVRWRPSVIEQERTALIALAGTTAYDVALFSYLVDRLCLTFPCRPYHRSIPMRRRASDSSATCQESVAFSSSCRPIPRTILMPSSRADELPFGDPLEDSDFESRRFPELWQAVAELRPGDCLPHHQR